MRAISLRSEKTTRDWQLAVAAGFVALTLFGAVVDRRNAYIDRSVVSPRSAERSVAPPTSREMAQEMLTHD